MRSFVLIVALLGGCAFDPGGTSEPTDKFSPGPEEDRDGDSVVDSKDNCVAVANPFQFDEDFDGVGNACDNCPHIANADQSDVGEESEDQIPDGVGDICDPRPTLPGDRLVVFEGFEGELSSDWLQVGGVPIDEWHGENGQLRLDRHASQSALYWNEFIDTPSFVQAQIQVTDQGAYANYGVLSSFSPTGGPGTGYYCAPVRYENGSSLLALYKFNGSGGTLPVQLVAMTEPPHPIGEGTEMRLTSRSGFGQTEECLFDIENNWAVLDEVDGDYGHGYIGLRARDAGIVVDYFVGYAMGE